MGATGRTNKTIRTMRKYRQISANIVKINDLRELHEPSPRRSRRDTKGVRVGWTQEQAQSRGHSPPDQFSALASRRVQAWDSRVRILHSPLPTQHSLAPLQNVKEQAPERLTASILPHLYGNTSTNICQGCANTNFSAQRLGCHRW
jgi:hypothetical protein